AELGDIWRLVLHGAFHGSSDNFPVVGMYPSMKVFNGSDIRAAEQSKHGFQVAEPGVPPGFNVPLPAHRLAGLQSRLQPIVDDCQLSLRVLSRRDISQHAGNSQELGRPVEESKVVRLYPNQAALRMEYSVTDLKTRTLASET